LKEWKEYWRQSKQKIIFLLLTISIIGEAAVFQVTSYTPPDNNIFFHSFAIAFILSIIPAETSISLHRIKPVILCMIGIFIWWSSVYWNYIQRIIQRSSPQNQVALSPSGENIVNRNTYLLNLDSAEKSMSQWTFSGLRSFDKIYMPEQTVKGIRRLLNMDLIKSKKELKVLNMTELTPLAVEIPYRSETGSQIPLWYHLGVGMFNREAKMYEDKIAKQDYDLVLFEYIPSLNNFFPFRVRDSLQLHYQKIDSFAAPRRNNPGMIEVFIPKNSR
jgi:hypothetical protein